MLNINPHQLLINLAVVSQKPTGISIYAKNLFPHLNKLQPTLLSSQTYANFNCYPVPANLTPEQGSKGHFDRLQWTQFELAKIYQSLKAKLLFSPLPEAPLFSQCRHIVHVHDLIPLRFPKRFSPLTPYFRYYIPAVLKQAQHIVCNSTSTANDIIDFYKVPASKITPILLGYDAQHFRYLELKKQNYFLYIGRQDPYKNLHRLITAFAALPNCKDYELWLVGPQDNRYTPLLKQRIAELGITQQVKLLGYVPYSELPKIINQALAFVFPSLWEGFGFPILEAMACGTPVVTSQLSSLPEVAGDAAIFINPYEVKEITAAMQAVASDNEMQAQLSSLGILRANQFSWEKTGQKTGEILASYL